MITVWLTQSEMNNLPVGGVWEGKLKLKYAAYGTNLNYLANITLKGKAIGKQDIFSRNLMARIRWCSLICILSVP